MIPEEIYVTCVCGAIVDENNLSRHVENCLKEEFIQKSVTLKIRHPPGSKPQHTKERHVCAECIRCGHSMVKHEGTFITFYPSTTNSSVTCCSYKCKQKCGEVEDPLCQACNLPNEFHEKDHDRESEFNCTEELDNMPKEKDGSKCREKEVRLSQFLDIHQVPNNEQEKADEWGSEKAFEHVHSEIYSKIHSGPPCKLFHIAILPSNRNSHKEEMQHQNYSLLLQILDNSPDSTDATAQTDSPIPTDVATQVKILGVYPEEVEKLLSPGSKSLPDFDPVAEAAFLSHLNTLLPCQYCARTFSPDRLMKHESCCIERPKTKGIRKCITPTDGTIGK